jgi:hypothetical protein
LLKLARYGNHGKKKPGLFDAAGDLQDLCAVIKGAGALAATDVAQA